MRAFGFLGFSLCVNTNSPGDRGLGSHRRHHRNLIIHHRPARAVAAALTVVCARPPARPSVRPSVRPSARQSVRPSVRPSLALPGCFLPRRYVSTPVNLLKIAALIAALAWAVPSVLISWHFSTAITVVNGTGDNVRVFFFLCVRSIHATRLPSFRVALFVCVCL